MRFRRLTLALILSSQLMRSYPLEIPHRGIYGKREENTRDDRVAPAFPPRTDFRIGGSLGGDFTADAAMGTRRRPEGRTQGIRRPGRRGHSPRNPPQSFHERWARRSCDCDQWLDPRAHDPPPRKAERASSCDERA